MSMSEEDRGQVGREEGAIFWDMLQKHRPTAGLSPLKKAFSHRGVSKYSDGEGGGGGLAFLTCF